MNDREYEHRLTDLLIAHAVYLSRYTRSQAWKSVKLLNRSLSKLQGELASRLIKIEERGLDVGPATTKRVNAQIKEIRAIIDDAYSPVNATILDDLRELAEDEASFAVKAIKTSKKSVTDDLKASSGGGGRQSGTLSPVKPGRKPTINLEVQFPTNSPAPTMVKAIVDTNPMSGKHLKSWADKLSSDTKDAVESAIRDGLSQANTNDQIVRSIIGTKANKYADGIIQGSRNSIDAMVRTAINHVHNVAAQLSYAENEDVIKGWKYLSVLDAKTTRFCIAHDGKKYKLGQGPIPPNHVRCRALCQPITLTMRELGVDVEEATPLTRASMDGPVAGDTVYETFLKTKSAAFQDKLLGKTLGKAFRTGKLPLKDLVADDGRELTIKQLRALHPTAF